MVEKLHDVLGVIHTRAKGCDHVIVQALIQRGCTNSLSPLTLTWFAIFFLSRIPLKGGRNTKFGKP